MIGNGIERYSCNFTLFFFQFKINLPLKEINYLCLAKNSQGLLLLGVVTKQRQWTTTKNSSSIDNDSKSKSIMSAKVETTVRQWSTPIEKVVEGQPPRPVSVIDMD